MGTSPRFVGDLKILMKLFLGNSYMVILISKKGIASYWGLDQLGCHEINMISLVCFNDVPNLVG